MTNHQRKYNHTALCSWLLGLCVLALCGCGKNNDTQPNRGRHTPNGYDENTLVIATMPTLDCLPLWIIHERGWMQTDKARLVLKPFNAGMDCDTALVGKSVDGAFTDKIRAERLMHKGVKLSFISETNAQWLLIGNRKSRVSRVEQLVDKTVGMARYAAPDVLTDNAIKKHKPKGEVFKIQINDINLRLGMLLNNELDAAYLPQPQAAQAVVGKNPILVDNDASQHFGVWVMRKDALVQKERLALLAKLKDLYQAACDSINQKGIQVYAPMIQKYTGVGDDAIKKLPKMSFKKLSVTQHK